MLLQIVDGFAGFEPIHGEAVAQMMEGEGPKIRLLQLHLLCHLLCRFELGGNQVAEPASKPDQRLAIFGPVPGDGRLPEQVFAANTHGQLGKEIGSLVVEIDGPSLVALADDSELAAITIEVSTLRVDQLGRPAAGLERNLCDGPEHGGASTPDHPQDMAMLWQHYRVAAFLKLAQPGQRRIAFA